MAAMLNVVACIMCGTLTTAWAAQYRGKGLNVTSAIMRAEEVRSTMLDELMSALGNGNKVTQKRLGGIEETLRPMFAALPKNEEGNLDHATARYALHRLFVQRHGMFVKGLEPGGKGWNSSSSPTEILDDLVPSYVQGLFEERVGNRGLGMHELSVLAATLEHLVHDEAVQRLRAAYATHAIPQSMRVPRLKVEGIVDTFMVLFLTGMTPEEATPENIKAKQSDIASVFPSWYDSKRFTRQVQKETIADRQAEDAFENGMLTFDGTAAVVEEVVERYGRWQDGECKDLKATMLKMEEKGTGRVPLKTFYGSALDGVWQFTESREYLRDLGALDETQVGKASVIIPNYINSHSNCMASSSIFSVCCLNECEPLLNHLEKEIAAPDAAPEQVIELVEQLPSSSISTPRQLSKDLKDLLAEVANHHGGRVPLHGRLFGQWMHHAYPRECPYPHKAGSTNPMTADEWIGDNMTRAHQASYEEMQALAREEEAAAAAAKKSAAAKPEAEAKAPMMWELEEELVAEDKYTRPSLLRRLAMLGAALALAVSLFNGVKSVHASLTERSGAKKFALPMVAGKSHYC